jgi:hypothetical protein
MGCGVVELRYVDSDRSDWVFFSSYYDYRLADGSKLHVVQRVAWCRTCRRFVLAEEVPSTETLQEEIDLYRSGDRERLERWAFISNGAPVALRIAELTRYVEWRLGRKSPPRCLECGWVELSPVPMDREFPHPETGERVIVGVNGFADTPSQPAEFSPEGERLEESSGEYKHGLHHRPQRT